MADGLLAPPLQGQLPGSPCYVCRSCTAIVGWPEHLVSYILEIIPNCFILTHVQTGNVFVELSPFERGMYRLVTLYCGICLSLIGWKIDQSAGVLSTRFFTAGRFILFARCIYFWNGCNLLDPVWSPDEI